MSGTPGPRARYPEAIHIASPLVTLTPEQAEEFNQVPEMMGCCMGSAVYGIDRCTCWRAVYSTRRRKPVEGEVEVRASPCVDCAYRPDSAERQDEFGSEHLDDLVNGLGVFVCHQGMAHIVEWRQPSGAVLPATRDEVGAIHTWAPRYIGNTAYKASGRPADLCAGWAARMLRAR